MKISIFLFYLGITIVYIFLINLIAENVINFSSQNYSITSYDSYGTAQIVGVSDSVSIGVLRPRPYGKILEKDNNSKLYLLNLIPLPLKHNGVSFIKFHIIFLIFLLFLIYRQKKKSEKTRPNTENVNYKVGKYNELPPLNF